MSGEFNTTGRRREFGVNTEPTVSDASAAAAAAAVNTSTAMNQVPAAPAAPEFNTDSAPSFTVIDIDSAKVREFSREYNPELDTVNCVADVSMLLKYMVETERKHNVTMSLVAYGIDPIVFQKAREAMDPMPEGTPACVMIPVPGKEDSSSEMYEMIDVDGVLYLSCLSESLNPDYLHQVIAEAAEGVFTHGRYVYTLVGPRPLGSGVENNTFVETLKLNSYELSILLSYMSQMPGVEVQHGTCEGRAAITFIRRQ